MFKLHGAKPITSGGLIFQTSDQINGFASWGTNPSNADPTGATLMNWGSNAIFTVSKAGGGLFELASLDLADNYNVGADKGPIISGARRHDGRPRIVGLAGIDGSRRPLP
ncbi:MULTISPECIES: hypothetical protein [unclassified Phenylobacterium]|uniref:hypothetical protein n=1 Tax=unclassified Phenylobacterium TaxID=2640670 RepID=UPI0022B44A1B|nr:hypothetical protein [Phenylobacterium sp. NIBR 498073]WGU42060.1 hypothetical protein O4N75_10080 [Phenylobacterium sp. NIBR 498073]